MGSYNVSIHVRTNWFTWRGFGFGYSATNHIGGQFSIIPGAAFPQTQNKIEDFIPVARISDLLLNPGGSFDFDGKEYKYPDIKLIYWAGGNPFHHHQDINRLLQAWQKPETIISNEWCWNALARHADIILPCTTTLERQDIGMTPRDPFVISMDKAIEPIGEARNDYDIFAGIARNLDTEYALPKAVLRKIGKNGSGNSHVSERQN